MSDALPKDFAAKRALLYGEKTTVEELNDLFDRYFEAERFGEALEMLERTHDEDRLARILAEGIARGSTLIVLRVGALRGEPVSAEDWRKAAASASDRGKYHDAYRAFLKAGDEEPAEALRREHMPDYEPFKPEGK